MNYYNAIGYYSPFYSTIYYNGYGYNFYYLQYGYYQDSPNSYGANGAEPTNYIGVIFVVIIICCCIGLCCFLSK